MKKNILITGGAGYIGSHAARAFLNKGYNVTIVDNLSTGFTEAIPHGCDFVEADVRDIKKITEILIQKEITGVVHFAAKIIVPESLSDPLCYYDNNTVGVIRILEAMKNASVKKIIFSSTAAVYGDAKAQLIKEETPLAPISPYGCSKYFSECILRDSGAAYGIKSVILRYFNVAGASIDGTNGQRSKNASHLIKLASETALGLRSELKITGVDYKTKDGTGIRDYIHVEDLVDIHVEAYAYLEKGGESETFNCGYGQGYSVREVVSAIQEVSGVNFKTIEAPRRPGDVESLVSQTHKLNEILLWKPRFNDLKLICHTAFIWESFLLGNKEKK
jgi:UDP-glucose 4-epimerase